MVRIFKLDHTIRNESRTMRIGKDTDLHKDLILAHKLVIRGTCLVVDPSAGSNSSLPGYCLMQAGDIIESGVLEISRRGPLNVRLRELSGKLLELIRQHDPDVLVYEDVPPQRYGGGNAEAHATLLKALGVVLSVPGPRAYVGLKPVVWKRWISPEYEKSDENDALEMARIVYEIAQEVEAEELKPKKSKKKTKEKEEAIK